MLFKKIIIPVLTSLSVASITLLPNIADAEVVSRILEKDSEALYYNLDELSSSYEEYKYGNPNGDKALLFRDYYDSIRNGANLVAFGNEHGDYIDIEAITQEYEKSKEKNEVFNPHTFVSNSTSKINFQNIYLVKQMGDRIEKTPIDGSDIKEEFKVTGIY